MKIEEFRGFVKKSIDSFNSTEDNLEVLIDDFRYHLQNRMYEENWIEVIEKILSERCSSFCLDNDFERKKVARILSEEIK